MCLRTRFGKRPPSVAAGSLDPARIRSAAAARPSGMVFRGQIGKELACGKSWQQAHAGARLLVHPDRTFGLAPSVPNTLDGDR
jgi:hypothetical protein